MLEVPEPEHLMLEDRNLEMKIWEVNFKGKTSLDIRISIDLKPPIFYMDPYDIFHVRPKLGITDYFSELDVKWITAPIEPSLPIVLYFGLGLHTTKPQAWPCKHNNLWFWVIFIQNLRTTRPWGMGLHHNLVHVCGHLLLAGFKINIFILILTRTCEFLISSLYVFYA